MKKLIILSSLTLSSLVGAATVAETIQKIETEKNANCEMIRKSAVICFNFYCRRTEKYLCLSNSSDFKIKLKIKTTTDANGRSYETVKRIVTIK
jgi:hypothetical protein